MGDFVDMTGDRYGQWSVISFARRDLNSGSMWFCRCSCGVEREVARKSLVRGASVSCGCIRSPSLKGRRFGRLVAHTRLMLPDGIIRWRCVCDCGTETDVTFANLVRNGTLSCGCYHREVARERRLSHGHTDGGHSATYNSWRAAKERCTNPDFIGYENYGGRGIAMCDRWLDSFPAFLADMGERPEGRSLDRIDNDKGYEAANCRWATPSEQRKNQRPPKPRMPKHDLLGRRFGTLHVAGYAGMIEARAHWHCQCDCGRQTVVIAKSLLRGLTRSCGAGLHRRR